MILYIDFFQQLAPKIGIEQFFETTGTAWIYMTSQAQGVFIEQPFFIRPFSPAVNKNSVTVTEYKIND